MAKKVLIVVGDGVEAQELFYPYYRLKEEGFEVDVAAPTKKDVVFTVVHDFEPGWETYTEKSLDIDSNGLPRALGMSIPRSMIA